MAQQKLGIGRISKKNWRKGKKEKVGQLLLKHNKAITVRKKKKTGKTFGEEKSRDEKKEKGDRIGVKLGKPNFVGRGERPPKSQRKLWGT